MSLNESLPIQDNIANLFPSETLQTETNDKLQKEITDTQSSAMIAMRQSADYGYITHSIHELFECSDYHSICIKLLKSLKHFGLFGTILVESVNKDLIYDSSGLHMPREESILKSARNGNAIIDFNERTLFNMGSMSVLIKNMPVQDRLRNDFMKDILHIYFSTTNAHIKYLQEEEIKELTKAKNGEMALMETLDSINNISITIKNVYNDTQEAMNKLKADFNNCFMYLGLSETQEDYLQALMNDTIEKLTVIQDQENQMGYQLDKIMNGLHQVVDDCSDLSNDHLH